MARPSSESDSASSFPVVLAIGGSDPSGGAGIQADLKVLHQHRVYGMAAVTLLTAQNTLGVKAVWPTPPEALAAQLEALWPDIPPSVVKVGALGTADNVTVVAEWLKKVGSRLRGVVVDPVFLSTSGVRLLDAEGEAAMRSLFPCTNLLTPNALEAASLSGLPVRNVAEAEAAARKIMEDGGPATVLVKGGHALADDETVVRDVWVSKTETVVYDSPRLFSRHTHGTGCALASAIAARYARNLQMKEVIQGAHDWLFDAMQTAPGLGVGHGPLNLSAPVHE